MFEMNLKKTEIANSGTWNSNKKSKSFVNFFFCHDETILMLFPSKN